MKEKGRNRMTNRREKTSYNLKEFIFAKTSNALINK